jgi:hypothetical protein
MHSLKSLTKVAADLSNEDLGREILTWMAELGIAEDRLRFMAERLVKGPGPDAGAGDDEVPYPSAESGFRHRFSASVLELCKDRLSNQALGREIIDWLDDLELGHYDAIYGRMRLLAERLVGEPAPTHVPTFG